MPRSGLARTKARVKARVEPGSTGQIGESLVGLKRGTDKVKITLVACMELVPSGVRVRHIRATALALRVEPVYGNATSLAACA